MKFESVTSALSPATYTADPKAALLSSNEDFVISVELASAFTYTAPPLLAVFELKFDFSTPVSFAAIKTAPPFSIASLPVNVELYIALFSAQPSTYTAPPLVALFWVNVEYSILAVSFKSTAPPTVAVFNVNVEFLISAFSLETCIAPPELSAWFSVNSDNIMSPEVAFHSTAPP